MASSIKWLHVQSNKNQNACFWIWEQNEDENKSVKREKNVHATALNVIKAIITIDCLIFGVFKGDWSPSSLWYYYFQSEFVCPSVCVVFIFVRMLLPKKSSPLNCWCLAIWFEFFSDRFNILLRSVAACDRMR